jgi:hypothetical protein
MESITNVNKDLKIINRCLYYCSTELTPMSGGLKGIYNLALV